MKILKKIEEHLKEKLKTFSIIKEGKWSTAWHLQTKSKKNFFLKTNTSNLPGLFTCEAEGLEEIAKVYSKHKLNTPKVHYVSEDSLLVDYIPSHPKKGNFLKIWGSNWRKCIR